MTDYFTTTINGIVFDFILWTEQGSTQVEDITIYNGIRVTPRVYDDLMELEDMIIEWATEQVGRF